jgi:hypothetical protein
LKVTKYCFKYVFKRPDAATIVIDEIDHYLSSHVLSAGEAAWRILGLRLHQEYPPVFRLDLHLPGQHRVAFDAQDPDNAMARVAAQTSTLIQWFRLNQSEASARQFRYQLAWLALRGCGGGLRMSLSDVCCSQVLRHSAPVHMERSFLADPTPRHADDWPYS